MPRFSIFLLLMAAIVWSSAGCTIVEKDNRRTLNYLDKHVKFESTGAKIAAAPIFIPVGLVAVITDAVIVNPAIALPKAYDDTLDIWRNPEGSDFRQMMLFVPKVVVTPIFFVLDWGARILIPFS